MSYRQEWMTDDQWACAELIADMERGFHHLRAKIKPWGNGISYCRTGRIATWDFAELSRLVVFAHDRCIRIEIGPAAPNRIRIIAHRRHKRDGSMMERHPTIEEHIAMLRPAPAEDAA